MSSKIDLQNSLLKVLECPICAEFLFDPRVLPSGHSFCGYPRICLRGLKSLEPDILKCAVCNQKFKLKLHQDLKPLFGIRDVLQELDDAYRDSGMQYENSSWMIYKRHGNRFTLWCIDCSRKLWSVCFEVDHIEHSVRSQNNSQKRS